MAEQNNPDKTKQGTKSGSQGIPEPDSIGISKHEKEPQKPSDGSTSKPKPPRELLVRLAGNDELKPFEEQTLLIAKRTYRLTKFGFFVALGAAVFVGIQVREMTNQTQILSNQAITAIANATASDALTKKQIDALQEQADAAKSSVTAIQRQMRQDQRAWINPALNFPSGLKENEPIIGSVHLSNSGKTPARNIVGEFVIEEVRNGQTPTFNYSGIARTRATAGSLFPGATFDGAVPWSHEVLGKAEPAFLSATDLDDYKSAKVFFVIYGRIDYLDVFDVPHRVTVCNWVSAPPGATAKKCTDYNKIDNN